MTQNPTPTAEYAPALRRVTAGGSRFQELGLVVVIAVIFIVLTIFGKINGSSRVPNTFLTLDNLINGVFTNASIFAIMAVGMTGVIISGGIDISVGSIMGFAAVMTAMALQYLTKVEKAPDPANAEIMIDVITWQAHPFIVWLVAIFVPIGIGLLCGLFNGLLIVLLRLHPFIVTLGTMAIFKWATLLPQDKSFPSPGYEMPPYFRDVMRYDFGIDVLAMPMIVTVLVAIAGWIYFSHTVWGRETYAVGGNEEAARYSGLNVGMIKLRTYVIMGLTCGVAALVSVGRYSSATTLTGDKAELTVIASAVVGGASLLGGRGTALGALLGGLILALISSGISTLKLNENHRLVIVGAAIIIAAALDRLLETLRQRRLMASRKH